MPQPPPARDNAAAVTGTAVISGRVFDATTGRSLSHVDVIAGPAAAQRATGETDGEGRYELAGRPARTYAVFATKANHLRKGWGEQRRHGSSTNDIGEFRIYRL